jgi:hypothetical protein
MRIRKKNKYTDPDGRASIPLTPRAMQILKRKREAFKEKFGREPGPDDPIFFDPNADVPRALNSEQFETIVTEAMRKAGVDEEFIYAYNKTGFIVGEHTPLTPAETAEWNAAILEYRKKQEAE